MASVLGGVGAYAQAPTPAATPPVRWAQSFEERLPGETPIGWGRRWGDIGDDLLSTSNIQALTGRRALLLDRTVGEKTPMSGVGVRVPDIQRGWAVATINFLVEGAGHDAQFSLLIREISAPNRVVASLGVGDRNVTVTGVGYAGKRTLGRMQAGRWYRVVLMLPTREGGQTQGKAQLFERNDAGAFVPLCENLPLDAVAAPTSGYGVMELVTTAGRANYLLYLDDLAFEQE
jgi:hypothetical protein